MSSFSVTQAQFALFAVYVLCFVALNAVALMISLFYRKKLRKSSPRGGFLAAIILAIICCSLLLGARNGSSALHRIACISLAGSAAASMFSTVHLFLVMRRVRK